MYDIKTHSLYSIMSKFNLKEKAIELRRKGFSYSEILKEILVAKSTLSIWLKEVGLSISQKQKITAKRIESKRSLVDWNCTVLGRG